MRLPTPSGGVLYSEVTLYMIRLAAVLAGWLALAASLAAAPPRVIAVNVDGVVHPVTVELVEHAIEQAREENAAAAG